MHERARRRVKATVAMVTLVAVAAMLLPLSVANAATPMGMGGGGVVPLDPGWTQDPTYAQAKMDGRITRTADGQVKILTQQPLVAPMYASSYTLYTGATGQITEPKGQYGTDDAGYSYNDASFWKFCGPGATTVAFYYWSNSYWLTVTSGQYVEPVNYGWHNNLYYYNTPPNYWNSSKGHSAILTMADYELPGGDSWPHPGIMSWEYSPWDTANFGTPLNRVHDALNWETTAPQSKNGFYVLVPSSSVSLSFLQLAAHQDIGNSHVPFVVAVNTKLANGEHLPQWTHSIWHYVAVVGYDDAAQTFTIIDTCGPSCSDQGPYGVGKVSQTWLTDLIKAIPDGSGGGLVW